MPKKSIFIVLLMLGLFASACNFPLTASDPAEVENAVAETVAALEAAEEEVVVPTLELAPTSTPMPTEEPEEEEDAEEVVVEDEEPAPTPCLSATAYDLTVPDDTKMDPGEVFDKAWIFKNVGYCTWGEDFEIVFVDGDQMGEVSFKKIGVEVDPNEEVEVLVKLYAPNSAGTYRGDWMLRNEDGVEFAPVWVQIKVVE